MPYLLFFLLLIPIGASAQGPLDGFMKGSGHLDLAPSFSFNSANSIAGANGQVYPVGYSGSLLGLFGTYGLTDQLDLVGTAAYVFTDQRSGLQDGGLFVKYRPFVLETGTAGSVSFILASGATFPIANYQPTATGALGQKAVVVPGRLIVQWTTPLGLFFNLTGGYNWRLDQLAADDISAVRRVRPDYQPVQPPDFSTFLFKIGLPARHYYLDAWLEYQHTAGGADYQPEVLDLPQSYGVSIRQIGGTAYYSENERTGFYVSTGYILGGRNTSLLFRATVGMVIKL